MIPKEIKYNLHYDDVRGDFLRTHHSLGIEICHFTCDAFKSETFSYTFVMRDRMHKNT